MHLIRAMILTAIILSAAAYAAAQNATPPKPDAANGGEAVYANECLALTYRLPDGWKFQKIAAPSPGQSKQKMMLLKAKPASADASNEWLEMDLLQTPLKGWNSILSDVYQRGFREHEAFWRRDCVLETVIGRCWR